MAVVSWLRGRLTVTPQVVGLELQQEVHHGGARRRPGAPVTSRPAAPVMASTTSRVWYAIASTTARARWAPVVPC